MTTPHRQLTRAMAIALLAVLLTYGGQAFAAPTTLAAQAAASCSSGSITPTVTEGPFYKAGSPQRASLLTPGISGTPVTITGYVYDKNCQPIANAWLDFWQASASGVYDNAGYTLRGHQYTDAAGRFMLQTVEPGEYPGRTEHIHVKVQAPSGPILTTQLFFPGVVHNSSDSIYDPALLMNVQTAADGSKTATFNFVLDVTTTPTAQTTPTTTASYTFPQTGFTVSGAFWTAWQSGRSFADSLYINGLPISAARNEVSPTDGKTYLTQWFERARLELHPQNVAPNNVLLGLLGTVAAQGKQNQAAFQQVSNPGGSVAWFSQTGHTVGNSSVGGQAIATAWTRLGGLAQFGYPISQPFTEVSKDDGKSYLVQYFERQRFEYHPENAGTSYAVLLGRLGAEQMTKTP